MHACSYENNLGLLIYDYFGQSVMSLTINDTNNKKNSLAHMVRNVEMTKRVPNAVCKNIVECISV